MIVYNSTLLRQLGSDILKECHPVIKNSAHLQMFDLSVYLEKNLAKEFIKVTSLEPVSFNNKIRIPTTDPLFMYSHYE